MAAASRPHRNDDLNSAATRAYLQNLGQIFSLVIIDSAGNLRRMLANEVHPADIHDPYGIGTVTSYLDTCLGCLQPGSMLVMAVGFLDDDNLYGQFLAIVQQRHDVAPGSLQGYSSMGR